MTDPSRRDFLTAIAGAAAALAHARLGVLQPGAAQTAQVRTVAGTGQRGYEPEGREGLPATATPVDNPYGIVPGPDDALYFCEVDTGRTRRLDPVTNRITTVAGTGEAGYSGDGGPALEASFSAPHEIRFDAEGHLFVVERDAHVVRRIDGRTGIVTTVAGRGDPGFSGDGGPGVDALLRRPHSIAFLDAERLLICDIGNHRVRVLDTRTGIIDTFAGTGDPGPTPDRGPLRGTALFGPRSIDTDDRGNAFLVLREGNAVYRLDPTAARLERIAGTGERGFTGDGRPAPEATFNGPKGIAWSAPDRSLYVVDTENHAIRRLRLETSVLDTVLGTGERGDGPDGDPLRSALDRPHGVCVHRGLLYVTDSENHRIRALEGILY